MGGEEVRWKTVRTYGKILATPLEPRATNSKKEQGQYPAILTEQAWSIRDCYADAGQSALEIRTRRVSFFPFLPSR